MFRINFIFILVVIFSCTYTPSGDNYKQLQTQDLPLPVFNLNDIDSDTINASPSINLEFDFTNEYRKIYATKIYLNNSLVKSINSGRSTINFSTKNLETGYHKLEFIITVSSGTNSLADQANLEFEQVNKTWTLAVDNDPATPVNITNVNYDTNLGALVVDWEKYTRINFGKYIIEGRKITNCPCNTYFRYVVEDQNSTSLKLPDYAGQEMEVSVIVVPNTNTGNVRGNEINVESSKIEYISSNLTNNNDLEVKWSKSIYDYSFGSYKLFLSSGFMQEEISISEINDTSYVFQNVTLGGDALFRLNFVSKNNLSYMLEDTLIPVNNEKLDFPTEEKDIYNFKYSNNYYFLVTRAQNSTNTFLEIFSEEENKIVQRQGPGNVVFTKDYVVLFDLNGSTFSSTSYSDIQNRIFINDDDRYIKSIKLITENIIQIERFTEDYSTVTKYIDLDNMQYVNAEDIEYPKYIYRSDNTIWDTELEEIMYQNSNHHFNYLNVSDNQNFVTLVSVKLAGGQTDNLDTKTYFKLFSAADFNVILDKKFDGNHQLIHVNDDYTKFLFYFPRRLVIIDRTGTIIQEIPIHEGVYIYNQGRLINNLGYIIKVDI